MFMYMVVGGLKAPGKCREQFFFPALIKKKVIRQEFSNKFYWNILPELNNFDNFVSNFE